MSPDSVSKQLDLISVGVLAGTFLDYLPKIAAVFTIVWTTMRMIDWTEARLARWRERRAAKD